MSRWCAGCFAPGLVLGGAPATGSINGGGAASGPPTISRSTVVTGLAGSLALLPLAWAQGSATRRRVPQLPAANLPHDGKVPAVWRACGLSGATVRDALQRLVPSLAPEPADLVIVAFGINDATSYRSPSAFADDLTELVTAARNRVGDAAVVVGGVAPLACFPALPWPLRSILGWRSVALQAAADRLAGRLPRLVVERFSAPLKPDLFAPDGFHPNSQAHSLWGEKIAALALPLVT